MGSRKNLMYMFIFNNVLISDPFIWVEGILSMVLLCLPRTNWAIKTVCLKKFWVKTAF